MTVTNKMINKINSDLIAIYKEAIKSVKPRQLMKSRISIKDNCMTVTSVQNSQNKFNIANKKIHLLGAGKSTLLMVSSFLDIISDSKLKLKSIDGAISLPIDQKNVYPEDEIKLSKLNINCMFGAKDNIPDNDSEAATKAIIDYIQNIDSRNEEHVFVFFLSGGASACLSKPNFISLEQKRDIVQLVRKTRNIIDLNKVRRFFSEVKGGGIATKILSLHSRSILVSVILSDIVGDPVEFIGSGPTSISPNVSDNEKEKQAAEVFSILGACGYKHIWQLPRVDSCARAISNSRSRLHNIIIGNNQILINVACKVAQGFGYHTMVVNSRVDCSCDDLLAQFDELKKECTVKKKLPCMLIAGGEVMLNSYPSESFGVGGRAQELSLCYMLQKLGQKDEQNFEESFLAGTTDGQDGPTDVAACLASETEWLKTKPFCKEDIMSALVSHNSYNFWTKKCPDWLLRTGMTGTNVMDLYMLLVQIERSF